MEEKSVGYIIPHTHWDREWRYPIWKNRMLLIEFMEELLNILETDPDYHCFLMDGQCVPIEDYLEVAPEKKDIVCKYIRDGRIAIGPWYTLPDLYPIDGECLVRNLLKGIRLSNKFGGCMKVGYNSFGWGQTSQFPQIYKEFGFDFIICAKKVSEERAPDSEFIWEAPDGTKVLTSRLGMFARANFFFHAYINTRYGLTFLSDEFRYTPWKSGLSCHKASEEDCDEDYFLIEPKKSWYPEYLKSGIEKAWKATDETVLKDHRLLLNGCDFSTPQPDLTKLIWEANSMFEDIEFVNCRLEAYVEKLKNLVDTSKLSVVKGELRDGPASDCSGNALASRIYIKQLNKKVQNILLHKAEPLVSILGMMGKEYPKTLLDIAWKYLLLAHPHDSINGVTQDKTAEDVVYRLNQALEIGNVVYDKATSEIIKMIDLSKYSEDELLMVVFNPIPSPVRDIIKVCMDTPKDRNVWGFKIFDCEGNEMLVQEVSRREKVSPVHDMEGRPWPNYTDRHICYMDCGEIPACGYKVYKIVPEKYYKPNHFYFLEMRRSLGEDISKADNMLENEYLKVQIASNGTLEISDKTTGAEYKNLNYFEDTGDVGNYWAYYPPYENRTYNSLGCNADIWLEDNGPLSATIGIELKMSIPAYSNEPVYGIRGESNRSSEKTNLVITSWISLKKGSRKVDIKTLVKNTAQNHRLRAAFPTGIKAEYSYASGHFTVDKRPRIPVKDKEGKYYPEMQTLPQQHFVDVSDGHSGLAFLNNCLTEFELKDDENSTLYLTLFRSVGNLIATGWECVGVFPKQKGSQMLYDLEYEYSIYPHIGDWKQGNVFREAEKLNVPLMPIQVSQHGMGDLPEKLCLFSIKPENLVFSTLKKAEDRDSYILRLYNPTGDRIEGEIQFQPTVRKAFQCNMNEDRMSELAVLVEQNKIMIDVESNKIVTIEIET